MCQLVWRSGCSAADRTNTSSGVSVRISAIVDAGFGVIADGVSAGSWTITEARE